jgi:hypothetical protein
MIHREDLMKADLLSTLLIVTGSLVLIASLLVIVVLPFSRVAAM